jgi:hypothetical protein
VNFVVDLLGGLRADPVFSPDAAVTLYDFTDHRRPSFSFSRADRPPPGNRGGLRLALESGCVAILPGVVVGGLLDYGAQHGDWLDAFIFRTRRQNLSYSGFQMDE